ncbi:conserved hypothetical protein [Theileria orientalis strain Shintoku]|uniref:Uncharacterized protein n=1 Tax=Theileria orientalis strain Shintoku TaxID=869250 RepID=J4C942_THEOR|nr:conserved hypothetical protein [Theileria orientalis strain Shintoku]BAM41883.1 conserved hypothetical protein [Theileria orientalis strain Shintoku]|eukprot:XP_009692184.1 conserved hypothetical protein [Theileria orientalis strain Shintoku]
MVVCIFYKPKDGDESSCSDPEKQKEARQPVRVIKKTRVAKEYRDKDSRGRDKPGRLIPSLIVMFVFLNVYIIIHQIDVNSRHFAVAFNIPPHNIGIYLDKLSSVRVVLMSVGSLVEYIIYLASGSNKYGRKVFSCISILLITLTRIGYVFVLYRCKKTSLRAYQTLNLEAFFHGLFQMAFFSLVPEYSTSTNLSVFASGMFVFLSQKIIDFFLFNNPMLNVKVMAILTSIITTMGLLLWYLFLFSFKYVSTDETDKQPADELANSQTQGQQSSSSLQATPTQDNGVSNIGFWGHLGRAFSPFMMFVVAAAFKFFLCPGLIPYALLERDKAHLINLIIPLFFILGSLSVFIPCEYNERFRTVWYPAKDAFWLLALPQLSIFILTLMSIHSRNRFAKLFINSKWRVMIATIVLIYCFTIMDSLSFVGVSNYVYKAGDEASLGVITLQNIVAITCIFTYDKLSVGYNDTRVSLGYHLPKFRPNHKMSKHNLAWYFIRNTFGRAVKDTISDLRMDIEKYL